MTKASVDFNQAQLRATADRLGDRINRYADNVALSIEDDLRAKVVSNAPRLTGKLQDSITTEFKHGHNGPTVRVGATAEHAPFVEFGTDDTPAQPFLRPAIAEMESVVKRAARIQRI
jgi:HK97 gp10 family phage protein